MTLAGPCSTVVAGLAAYECRKESERDRRTGVDELSFTFRRDRECKRTRLKSDSCGRQNNTRGLGGERNCGVRREKGGRASQVEELQHGFGAGDRRVAGGGVG